MTDIDKRIANLELVLQPKGGGGGYPLTIHFPKNCVLSSAGGGGSSPKLSEVQNTAQDALNIIRTLRVELAASRELVRTLGQSLEHLNYNAKTSRADMGLATFVADEAIAEWRAYLTKTEGL